VVFSSSTSTIIVMSSFPVCTTRAFFLVIHMALLDTPTLGGDILLKLRLLNYKYPLSITNSHSFMSRVCSSLFSLEKTQMTSFPPFSNFIVRWCTESCFTLTILTFSLFPAHSTFCECQLFSCVQCLQHTFFCGAMLMLTNLFHQKPSNIILSFCLFLYFFFLCIFVFFFFLCIFFFFF
jgi:hypothetical protein